MNRPRTPSGRSPAYQVKSFIVRLWQRPEGFKAEARSLTGGGKQTFNSLEGLLEFLREQAEMQPQTHDEGGDNAR